jgi:NACalpha-BTF3-like transcription factor
MTSVKYEIFQPKYDTGKFNYTLKEDDLNLIMNELNCNNKLAEVFLYKNNGDIIDTIIDIDYNIKDIGEIELYDNVNEIINDINYITKFTKCNREMAFWYLFSNKGDIHGAIYKILMEK